MDKNGLRHQNPPCVSACVLARAPPGIDLLFIIPERPATVYVAERPMDPDDDSVRLKASYGLRMLDDRVCTHSMHKSTTF